MVANLATVGGKIAHFYNKEEGVPWHKCGTPMDGLVTAAEGRKAAGHDFEVEKFPLYTYDEYADDPEFECLPVPNMFGLVRSDTKDVLGTVTGAYRVYQNSELWDFSETLIGEGKAVYSTAGALGKGEQVWILAKLPRELYVPHSELAAHTYLLLSSGHDGETPVRVFGTNVWVVCQNTLNAALSAAGRLDGRGITIRHTERLEDRVREAQYTLGLIGNYFDKMQGIIDALSHRPVTQEEVDATVKRLLPSALSDDMTEEEREQLSRQRARQRKLVTELFETSPGNAEKGVRGTAFALFQAATDFADHYRSIRVPAGKDRGDARMKSAVFGTGADFKIHALRETAKLAGVRV